MPPLRAPKNNGYFNKNLIMLVAYFSPNSYVTPLSIGTSFGESATRGDREQVGERKESRWNDGGWKDDERATRSTQIARTVVVFFKHLVVSTCQFFGCHVNPHRSAKFEFTSRYSGCINCIEHEAIALRDTRVTTVVSPHFVNEKEENSFQLYKNCLSCPLSTAVIVTYSNIKTYGKYRSYCTICQGSLQTSSRI
ncbi:hypothetical protein G5I_01560 [Acromyrmex echinatior]|uniref:Uncharacterized protein n=1 Tax=Acromyrmex echinatior TaxID=103372 RepID=F4W7Y3_ACREC|nr:hypothetical protein G5I_01560 [Acromyrmex echinatior]